MRVLVGSVGAAVFGVLGLMVVVIFEGLWLEWVELCGCMVVVVACLVIVEYLGLCWVVLDVSWVLLFVVVDDDEREV